jgi:uncharacterized protein YndB with AHSA1/START domain
MPDSDGNAAELTDQTLVISRVFDAPRDRVFKAWTDPRQAMRWMGPREHPVRHIEQDLRPGGAWRACLRAQASGEELWQGGVYREIHEPERLVFTFAWDRAGGERGPETLVSITFDEHHGKTRMTFRQTVFETRASRDGHRQGWTSSFDRLQNYLAAA